MTEYGGQDLEGELCAGCHCGVAFAELLGGGGDTCLLLKFFEAVAVCFFGEWVFIAEDVVVRVAVTVFKLGEKDVGNRYVSNSGFCFWLFDVSAAAVPDAALYAD